MNVLGYKNFEEDHMPFTTGNGIIKSIGKVTLTVRFGEEKYPQNGIQIEFTVMEGIPEPMFIGMGILKKWIINCKNVNVEEKLDEGRKVLFTLLQQKRLEEMEESENSLQILETEHDQDEFEKNLKIGELNDDEKHQLRELIEEFKDVIALSTSELGRTNIEKHRINTKNNQPIAIERMKKTEE